MNKTNNKSNQIVSITLWILIITLGILDILNHYINQIGVNSYCFLYIGLAFILRCIATKYKIWE